MGFTLPLVNYHYVKRRLRHIVNFVMGASANDDRDDTGKPILSVNTTCAYCNQRPTLPYHMGCAHVFCYYCLKGNLIADEQFECPTCQRKCRFCEPL